MQGVDEFHKWYEESRTWEQTKWLGVPMWKLPFDAVVMQELIYKVKPDNIIETGTGHGGSAVFYASIMQMMGYGNVITIDIKNKNQFDKCDNRNILSRIRQIMGSSIDQNILDIVDTLVSKQSTTMVILDSWHTYDHVLQELEMYHRFVSCGSYLIVEDTHVSGHPIEWKYGKGPYEAVEDFLKKHQNFEVDQECEKHLMTFNPKGYLRRVT